MADSSSISSNFSSFNSRGVVVSTELSPRSLFVKSSKTPLIDSSKSSEFSPLPLLSLLTVTDSSSISSKFSSSNSRGVSASTTSISPPLFKLSLKTLLAESSTTAPSLDSNASISFSTGAVSASATPPLAISFTSLSLSKLSLAILFSSLWLWISKLSLMGFAGSPTTVLVDAKSMPSSTSSSTTITDDDDDDDANKTTEGVGENRRQRRPIGCVVCKIDMEDGETEDIITLEQEQTSNHNDNGTSESSDGEHPNKNESQPSNNNNANNNDGTQFTGYIGMLAVEKTHRRSGIGTVLVQRAIHRMAQLGCHSIKLETEVTNKGAMNLYEDRLGFVREELLKKYYLNWGDAYRLRLWITGGR
mmetsp:Transcript_4667/g.7479  ORF Transcript_4667/g.7479 Transcript_4667/m.7479 type:complete len:361 (-) Transcript_4667:449-1531(-)